MPYSERRDSNESSVASPAPIPLPRLQYLAFAYRLNTVSDSDPIHLTDLLLSLIFVPPTCHMYLCVPGPTVHPAAEGVADVLHSVCRRVPEKQAVSHMFFRLSDRSSPMQLVFRQGGSLRLQVPPLAQDNPSDFPYHDFFRAFRPLFATTEELRIHYTNDRAATAALDVLPACFPSVAVLSVIRTISRPRGWPMERPASLSPQGSRTSGSSSHRLSEEIKELETTLAARAALGLPIRRLIVTLRASPLTADPEGELDNVRARLHGLDATADSEVMVMDGEASSELWEKDWLTRLPDRYDLPASIHRDWPTVWGAKLK
ncbi:hypothetical protein GSI_07756 [Ganoderma sinense ZZ0214-1]|uniref:Uncharacterized protein n=1 Tax=Ganoderma sinense ZZ0214-1 TaxID=1077348 RepID=A0A2G8S9C6_9APHY|nr:hypothetical protein GSI_07679 [Ganoderma sinense ZZ0214-1]PIL30178.1 hypothetical protein GSI_07756 [Ganoderma sinense ZZ0214-1]